MGKNSSIAKGIAELGASWLNMNDIAKHANDLNDLHAKSVEI